MEVVDKLLHLTIVAICVVMALGLFASDGHFAMPSTDITALHGAITSVALKPGSKVVVVVHVPKTVSITIRGSILTVTGSSIPIGYVKAMDRAVGIVHSVAEGSIVYKVKLSNLDLIGGLSYTLVVECVDINTIAIRVLCYRVVQ